MVCAAAYVPARCRDRKWRLILLYINNTAKMVAANLAVYPFFANFASQHKISPDSNIK